MTQVYLYKLEKNHIWLFTSGLRVKRGQPEVAGGDSVRRKEYSVIVIVVNSIRLLTKGYKANHLRFLTAKI